MRLAVMFHAAPESNIEALIVLKAIKAKSGSIRMHEDRRECVYAGPEDDAMSTHSDHKYY